MASAISVERFVQELEKLHDLMVNGNLAHGEYDQCLATTIQELKERGIDGDRATVQDALTAAAEKGTITAAVHDHLLNRLGLK